MTYGVAAGVLVALGVVLFHAWVSTGRAIDRALRDDWGTADNVVVP